MDITDLQTALEYFSLNRIDYVYYNHLKEHFDKKGTYSIIDVLLILRKLTRDGFVISEEQEQTHYHTKKSPTTELVDGYFITFEGFVFFQQGGYAKQKELKEKKAIEKKDAHELDMNLKRNQIKVNWLTVGIGLMSFIFIGLSVYFEAKDKTDEELKLLRLQLQQQEEKRNKLESSLHEINLSIQSQKNDTAIIKVLQQGR